MVYIYGLQDVKAESFAMPFFLKADGEAIRAVRSLLGDDNLVARHPEDFRLWCLGTFDPSTGQFSSEGTRLLVEVSSLVRVGATGNGDARQMSLPVVAPPAGEE